MRNSDMGVYNGIDVLRRKGGSLLRGQRAGLITNHTGMTRDGQSTIDTIYQMDDVVLKALFGPEHGVRGKYDQSHIDDGIDTKTSLPVYSLYGERKAPDTAQLADIDTLIFDIQDIGCRFYTYISTLGNVMEAAQANALSVVVLDRPNPITGLHASGPLPDSDKLSFTAYHRLPLRHGLTVGEIARLIHTEQHHTFPLTIVPCEGWSRADWYDATGLIWINPSPNMRSLAQATLYPGIGLLEQTNISVGRGTDTPFEWIGAPWLNSRALASRMNNIALPGVRFIPVDFTPRASVHAKMKCGGVQFIITDRDQLSPVQLGLTLAQTLLELHPSEWQSEKMTTLLANQGVYNQLMKGWDYDRIAQTWEVDLLEFKSRISRCLLY